jgi:DNA-binding YbaB/EbfC family protein
MQSMMAQAQKLQKELEKKMSDFKSKAFQYSYKNDSVVIIIKGDFTILQIKINSILIDPEDKQTLEEMVGEAMNAAIKGVQADQDAIQSAVTNNRGF